MLVQHGFELRAAVDSPRQFVPERLDLVRPLRESLLGEPIDQVMGIVNGTTNYILDRMDSQGDSLENALAEATRLGYAEADPTADIEGFDAAQKAAILASLAFHTTVPLESVHREGITSVTLEQVQAGLAAQWKKLGHR